jgi:hypothetical protein
VARTGALLIRSRRLQSRADDERHPMTHEAVVHERSLSHLRSMAGGKARPAAGAG